MGGASQAGKVQCAECGLLPRGPHRAPGTLGGDGSGSLRASEPDPGTRGPPRARGRLARGEDQGYPRVRQEGLALGAPRTLRREAERPPIVRKTRRGGLGGRVGGGSSGGEGCGGAVCRPPAVPAEACVGARVEAPGTPGTRARRPRARGRSPGRKVMVGGGRQARDATSSCPRNGVLARPVPEPTSSGQGAPAASAAGPPLPLTVPAVPPVPRGPWKLSAFCLGLKYQDWNTRSARRVSVRPAPSETRPDQTRPVKLRRGKAHDANSPLRFGAQRHRVNATRGSRIYARTQPSQETGVGRRWLASSGQAGRGAGLRCRAEDGGADADPGRQVVG